MFDEKDDVKRENRTFGFFIKGIKTLWELLETERRNIIIVICFIAFGVLLILASPYTLKLIFDELPNVIKQNAISDYLVWLVIILFSVRIVDTIFHHFVKEIKFLKSIIRLENLWPVLAQDKLLALSLGYHEKENTGKKISKITKGCERLVDLMAILYWQILPQMLFLVINIVIVIIIDWRLGLLFLAPFVPAAIVNIYCYKKYGAAWEEWEKKKESATGLFCQSLINVGTVQNYVQENREKANFGEIREEMKKLDIDVGVGMQKYFAIMSTLLHIFFSLTIVFGIYFVYKGESTIGTVIYILATGNSSIGNLWGLIHSYIKVLRHMIAVNRMKKLLDEEIDIKNSPDAKIPKDYSGKFEFRDATFVYPGKEKAVLEKINISISPNEMVALVGKSGEGKTTIARLLGRVHDITSGTVLLDERSIRNLDLYWYRRLFAIVTQDVDIFDASLMDNIKYANTGASDEWVRKAIKAAHLEVVTEDKERFPDGIDTQVGERGIKLSGGERQRVGIARAYIALLSGSKVLILDEATSHLDSEAEKAIQFMINELQKEMSISIVVIAHRLSTVQKANMIYVVGDGKIIEQGDHRRLISKNGLYSHLVELQKLGDLRE